MRRMASFLALLAASTAALATPTEVTAEYRLSSAGLTIAHVNESFQRKGDYYTIQSVTRSEGVLKIFLDDELTMESSGRFGAGGLQPLTFDGHRAKDSKGDVHASFDWDKGVIRSVSEGTTSEMALPRETQDRISVMYQFMNLTQHGDVVVMPMSDGRRVEYYTYRLVDQPRVSTPAGEFDTFHYARVTESPKDNKAEVWLAKDHFNFPVRVVFVNRKGLKFEQTLESLKSR